MCLQQQEEIKCFINELEEFKLSGENVLNDDEAAIIYYIAGYIEKSLAKEGCGECNELLSPGKVPLNISCENLGQDENETTMKAKEEFITAISRGGLTKPSDYIYISCVHASALNTFIFSRDDLKKYFFATKNPRDTFIGSFLSIIENNENSSQLLNVQCSNGHNHGKYLRRIAFTIFNISSKNYASELNDSVRKNKVSKPSAKNSKATRKITKLQSQSLC